MGDLSSLTTNPAEAREGAHRLEKVQQQWADALREVRPNISVAAFGEGYGHFGATIAGLATKAHDVRLAHARRLSEAARAGRDLINAVHGQDSDSAGGLGAAFPLSDTVPLGGSGTPQEGR